MSSHSKWLSVECLRNSLLHHWDVQAQVFELFLEYFDELLLQQVFVGLAHGAHHEDLSLGLLSIQELEYLALGRDGGVNVRLQFFKFLFEQGLD